MATGFLAIGVEVTFSGEQIKLPAFSVALVGNKQATNTAERRYSRFQYQYEAMFIAQTIDGAVWYTMWLTSTS